MATLVFSAVGTALAGPLGGAIGSLVGRQIDTALFGTTRKGARLKELDATTSTYGVAIPRHYGVMRVAGSIIWASELVEHSETQGTGKGSPSITTYSYTANFAVALGSRPISGVGRIWADGTLLRGEDGALKVGGTIRIHTGHADQEADPLLVASEGSANCPAYRGLAYVVFEDLDLADYYNHIPALTFEVLADESVELQTIVSDALDDVDAEVDLAGLAGFTCDGPVIEALEALDTVIALDADAALDTLVIGRERLQEESLVLEEPAIPSDGEGFGSGSGYARHRAPVAQSPLALLRYYDIDRDYLPGVQRALGQPSPGEPQALELPAALTSATAAELIRKARYRSDWSRETISWRTTQLDTAVAPGSLVSLPSLTGQWRVTQWEWCDNGVELSLERVMPATSAQASSLAGSSGRFNEPLDAPSAETSLVAFELPLDSTTGLADTPLPYVAVSSSSETWTGAALYADRGDGELHRLGSSGRVRSTIGTTDTVLASASPHLFDRNAQLDVTLLDPSMQLSSASTTALAEGANRALVGEELIQFANAASLGGGQWRLEGLLRGRAGTEAAISSHSANEAFVLLDASARALDSSVLGASATREVVAIGRGDEAPVRTSVHLDGLTRRPLSPVHPSVALQSDGTVLLGWVRRARGAWLWLDGIDTALIEETESYLVTFGDPDQPLASWYTTSATLEISATLRAELLAQDATALLQVRQQGTHTLSLPLVLGAMP